MAKFSPGDKVSFINEKLNGIVKQVTGRGEVLITLDDGFEIPVDTRELVLVESGSKSVEKKEIADEKFATPRAELEEKIAFGFVVEGAIVKAYLLNNSPHHLLYLIYNTTVSPKLVAQGSLEKATSVFLASFPLSGSESWRQWRIQMLRNDMQKKEVFPIIDHSFKVRDTALMKGSVEIPFLGKKGFVAEVPVKPVSESQADKNGRQRGVDQVAIQQVEEVVDLHAKDIAPADSIMAESILHSQLGLIQNSLEKAVAQGMGQIIFIHGVGNGTLKMEMQKILMRHGEVIRWEEADTKKFGYGATAVYLKTS